jgi:hypothetical protein
VFLAVRRPARGRPYRGYRQEKGEVIMFRDYFYKNSHSPYACRKTIIAERKTSPINACSNFSADEEM